MTPKLKKIIFTILILGIMFLIYAIFIKPDPSADVLIQGSGSNLDITSQEAKQLGIQISQALLRIEQIKLDRNIFENKIFLSLKDRSRAIIDEPIGRTNPFAPLGDTSVNVSTRAQNATSTDSSAGSRPATSTSPTL